MKHRTEIAVLAALIPGAWLVFFAWPPVRPLAVYEPTRATPIEESAPIATDGGGRRTRERTEVRVVPPPPSDLVRVHGRVTQRGRPVSDHDLLFQIVGTGRDDPEEWNFTDEDGTYEVLLAPGSYRVRSEDGGAWLTNVVILEGEDEHHLDIALPSGIVRGRVLPGATGVAVARVTVHALRHPDDVHVVSTRADGSFELAGLQAGEHVLVATTGNLSTLPVHGVVTDAPLEDLELTFLPGHTLRGIVRGPGNEPVAMELRIIPGTRLRALAQLEIYGVHYSDYAGEFAIQALQSGPYVVVGRGETRTHDFALQTTIDLRPGAPPIELFAQRCGTLVITIVRPDGTPLPGARIDLRTHDGEVVLGSLEWLEEGPLSDDEGRIELDDVLPGWYRVTAEAGARLSAPAQAEVRSEKTTPLRLTLD